MTKKSNLETKRGKKLQVFLERQSKINSLTKSAAKQSFSNELGRFFRINKLKCSNENSLLQSLTELGWSGKNIPWMNNGYTIDTGYEAVRDSSFALDGLIYIQNASSWLPVLALDPKEGSSVLDLCAAPGGKTSHIADISENKINLFVNDNSKNRLHKLRQNLNRIGVNVSEYFLINGAFISRKIDQKFDYILLDAPCSGEGLINLSKTKSLDTWSVAHIKRLSKLQKQLIGEAWRLLNPGGTLVYSTCTLAPEENEMVVDWLLRKNKNAEIVNLPICFQDIISPSIEEWNNQDLSRTKKSGRISPNKQGLEPFFIAKIVKKTEDFNVEI